MKYLEKTIQHGKLPQMGIVQSLILNIITQLQ